MGAFQQCVIRKDWQQLIDDILLAKITHMNYIRLTQTPVQPEIYDYCDRLGLMLQTDLPLFGNVKRNQFCEVVRQAEEMERLVRSHPSNIMVTYINEPFPNASGNPQRNLTREEMTRLFEAADMVGAHGEPRPGHQGRRRRLRSARAGDARQPLLLRLVQRPRHRPRGAAQGLLAAGEAESQVAEAVRAGATALFLELPEGKHRIAQTEVAVGGTPTGLHFVSRDTGHRLVAGFHPEDFKFWYDARVDHPTPLLRTPGFQASGWEPVLLTHQALAAGCKAEGKGCWCICQMELAGRTVGNAVAAIFARRLLDTSSPVGR